MTIAVASTASASQSGSSSVSVTAPTGIQVGDLLVIVAVTGGGTSSEFSISSTGFSESFKSYHDPGGGTSACKVSFLYKIAVSADTSAGSYSVSYNGSGGAAAMFRITGWTAGDPFAHAIKATNGIYQDGSITINDSVSLTRVSQQLIIMAGLTAETFDDAGGTFSFASYQITSSDSNPSWTELADTQFDNGDGRLTMKFFCAYAVSSDTSTVTSYGFAKTGDSAANEETTAYAISFVFDPISDAGTSALHSADADFFAPTATAGATGTNALLQADADFSAPTAKGTSPTQWTPETKPSTTWTPQSK